MSGPEHMGRATEKSRGNGDAEFASLSEEKRKALQRTLLELKLKEAVEGAVEAQKKKNKQQNRRAKGS